MVRQYSPELPCLSTHPRCRRLLPPEGHLLRSQLHPSSLLSVHHRQSHLGDSPAHSTSLPQLNCHRASSRCLCNFHNCSSHLRYSKSEILDHSLRLCTLRHSSFGSRGQILSCIRNSHPGWMTLSRRLLLGQWAGRLSQCRAAARRQCRSIRRLWPASLCSRQWRGQLPQRRLQPHSKHLHSLS